MNQGTTRAWRFVPYLPPRYGEEYAMSDKVPMPVSGNPDTKGAPDGVGASPAGKGGGDVHGRSAGGESGGGAYPNPHAGKVATNTGFMAPGG